MSDNKPKWVDLFGIDPTYGNEELAAKREELFQVFKAGWMAAAKAVEGELKDRGRGWNDCDPNDPILMGMREGLQTAVNTIRLGHQPSWRPHGRHDAQEAFEEWLDKQFAEVENDAPDAKNTPRDA